MFVRQRNVLSLLVVTSRSSTREAYPDSRPTIAQAALDPANTRFVRTRDERRWRLGVRVLAQ